MKRLSYVLLCALGALAACGDDSTPADSGASDASPDSSQPDGSAIDAVSDAPAPDDASAPDALTDDAGAEDASADDATPPACDTSDDCGGEACFLYPGDGDRDCVEDPGDPPRNACEGVFVTCDCTDDAGCTEQPGGHCIAFEYRYCGGAPPPETNVCRYDECSEDADCDARAGGACIPPGLGNFVATCAYGPCRTSADCNEDGICEIYDDGCGTSGAVLFCRYPDDVCSESVPCEGPMPMKCVPNEDGQGTRCVVDLPRP